MDKEQTNIIKDMAFEEAIDYVIYELNIHHIYSYDDLKDIAINAIENDNILLAEHILDALHKNMRADYFGWDISMGTMETITPINDIDDLIKFIE